MPDSVDIARPAQAGPTARDARGPVVARPGPAWDAYDAYLFDIDGTLMRDRARVHARCFSLACEAVLGHPLSLEAVHVSGSTDPRILRDAFAAAGIPEARWRPRSREILDALCQAVARQADHMQLHLMPGVLPVLDHLASRGRCLGVATGNLERIGWLKLERTGLRRYFAFGGFSDAYEERADMIAAAAEAAREVAGRQASLVVVGDTPADICAAHANRIPVLAVATGHFTFDQLLGSSPEICAETLAALRETAR